MHSIIGDLPDGISFDEERVVITGTPTKTGTTDFIHRVEYEDTDTIAQARLRIVVEEAPDPEPDGQLPGHPADRAVLLAFYAATGGGSAWTDDNWGSDEPIGTWQGVTTDTEGRVIRLVLSELGLTGSIPTALGQLTNLQTLWLYKQPVKRLNPC